MKNLVATIQSTRDAGSDFRSLFECTFGLVMALDLHDDHSAQSESTTRYPRHTCAILRLGQNYLGKHRTIYANSQFSSLATAKALLENGTHFMGELGQFSKGVPTALLKPDVRHDGSTKGAAGIARVSLKVNDEDRRVFVHSWSESSTSCAHRRVFVSTLDDCLALDFHTKSRCRIDPATGNKERVKRTVSAVQSVKSYLSACAVVEVHKHLMNEIERMARCRDAGEWWLRMFCHVLLLVEVDAFKIYSAESDAASSGSHSKFLDKLCAQLFANCRDGSTSAEAPQHPKREKKRARVCTREAENGAGKQDDQHVLITILDFMKQNHNYNPSASDLKWGKRVRCRMCKSTQGWGNIANFCCQLCSSKDPNKKPFGICGPGTGRDCYMKHLSNVSQQK